MCKHTERHSRGQQAEIRPRHSPLRPPGRQSPHTGLTQYSAQQTAGFQKNASNRQVGIAMCVSCASRFRDAGTDKSNLVRNLCALHSSEESSYHWSSYGIKLRKKIFLLKWRGKVSLFSLFFLAVSSSPDAFKMKTLLSQEALLHRTGEADAQRGGDLCKAGTPHLPDTGKFSFSLLCFPSFRSESNV